MAKLIDVFREILGDKLDEEVDIKKKDEKNKGIGDKEDDIDKSDEVIGDKKNSNNVDFESILDKYFSKVMEDKTSDKEDSTDDGEVNEMGIFKDGWLNTKTGEIDTTKIENKEVVEALNSVAGIYSQKGTERMINDSIVDAVSKIKLAVKPETVVRLIDKSTIRVDGDKIVGIETAIDSLKKAEPGLFVDESKENNPINEGFDPVNVPSTSKAPNSLIEAFALENASKK